MTLQRVAKRDASILVEAYVLAVGGCGEPTARVAGAPGELLLYLFGRQSAAHVEVSGPDAAGEAVRRARFGM